MQKSIERVVPSHLFALVKGAWSYSQVCRIHSTAIPSKRTGIMTKSRLHLAGSTSTKSWILIHLFAAQHMEGGFG